MKYINKNQKVVLIIIISIIIIGICYYTYVIEGNSEFEIQEQNLEIQENSVEEEIENKEEINKIIVHVSGAVNQEGIVELDEKARVADAIEAVGGVTENAYMKDINLALLLEDGMKIYIPTKEEVENNSYVSSTEQSEDNTSSSNNIISQSNKNSKININTASVEELDTLPGIGEATANKIINYRKENGNFKTIEEIKEVSGIGDSKFEKIKDLIEV